MRFYNEEFHLLKKYLFRISLFLRHNCIGLFHDLQHSQPLKNKPLVLNLTMYFVICLIIQNSCKLKNTPREENKEHFGRIKAQYVLVSS